MKRFIALFLAASMLFTAVPVFAADRQNTDYESIITTVRDVFDLPEDLSNVQISQHGDSTYISWSYDNGGRQYDISADEHGCVTSYYSYDYRDYSESRSMGANEKINKARAQKTAERVLAALYGESAANFVCKDTSIDSSEVSFVYYYTQNGIEVDEPVQIGVNRLTGDISRFYGLCRDVLGYEYTVPDNTKLIDNAKALESCKENKKFRLVYKSFYDALGKRYVKPVYIIDPAYINAVDGSIVDEDYDFYNDGYSTAAAAEEDAGYGGTAETKRVTKYEQQAIEDYKNLISDDKADNILRKFFPALKDFEFEESYTYWYDDKALMSVDYKPIDKSSYGYAGAELDAKTGEVTSYYYHSGKNADEDFEYDAKKSTETAERLFKAIAHDIYSSGEYTVDTSKTSDMVVFNRIYNGITVDGQSVAVGLDSSYNVDFYSKSWYETEFPELSDIVDESEIFDTCAESNGYDLKYVIHEGKPVLVFGFESEKWFGSFCYDAKTGQRISSYSGEVYEETADGKYTDLENSPYKETVETLAEYGYRLPYSKFEPDKPITIEDFCTFLSFSSDYIIYSDKPIYTESQLDKNATKYDIAAVLVDVMGYTELAKKDIFVDNFEDVDEKYKGTVAIAAAMGLVFEKQGRFNGTETVTRGQAAEYIYNILAVNNML